MKILIASGSVIDVDTLTDKSGTRSTSQVYAINLIREFKTLGINPTSMQSLSASRGKNYSEENLATRRARYDALDFDRFDHAICTEQNGFENREPYFLEFVRRHTDGRVCTIADHDRGNGEEDLVLHARRDTGHRPGRSAWIGWAADSDLFRPEKLDDVLTIFVDHKYYIDPSTDWTERLLAGATQFAKEYEEGLYGYMGDKKKARVIFLGPDGIEEISPPEIRVRELGDNRREFLARVPQREIAAALNAADIYVVTHKETMGLATLEAAMAGALILAPRNFMRSELLYPLHHIEFDHAIDWHYALVRIDASYSRDLASEFTWPKLAARILDSMTNGDGDDVPALTKKNFALEKWRYSNLNCQTSNDGT